MLTWFFSEIKTIRSYRNYPVLYSTTHAHIIISIDQFNQRGLLYRYYASSQLVLDSVLKYI